MISMAKPMVEITTFCGGESTEERPPSPSVLAELSDAFDADSERNTPLMQRHQSSTSSQASPRFEAFVMTGDHILRLDSKTSNSSIISPRGPFDDLPAREHKVSKCKLRNTVAQQKSSESAQQLGQSDTKENTATDTESTTTVNDASCVTVNALCTNDEPTSSSAETKTNASSAPNSPAKYAFDKRANDSTDSSSTLPKTTSTMQEPNEAARRLAQRLYLLDGFRREDVQSQITKNNEFSAAVAAEYLALYNFAGLRVDAALRRFLAGFALHGESQERERVLMHFSRRYLHCNPSVFDSEDEVHTLVVAIMLLNTDLHGPNIGKRMTCHQFIDNLGQMDFKYKRDLLKTLYQSIKDQPIDDSVSSVATTSAASGGGAAHNGNVPAYNSLLRRTGSIRTSQTENDIDAHVEYKKGWIMRKCDRLEQGKRAPFGRRGWRMFYATLKGLQLYLHKDDSGFRKGAYQTYRNGIRIHHAYAYAPNPRDYNKRQHVFAVRTADQCEYLLQTDGPAEVASWIETINFVAASFSAPPLPAPVGSNTKSGQFHKYVLPNTATKLPMEAQITEHDHRVGEIVDQLASLHADAPPRTAKGQRVLEFFHKERYLEEEKQRYMTYVTLLRARLPKTAQSVLVNGSVTNRPLGACPPQISTAPLTDDASIDGGFGSSIRAPADTSDDGESQPTCASHQSDRLSYREAVDDYEPPTHHQSLQ